MRDACEEDFPLLSDFGVLSQSVKLVVIEFILHKISRDEYQACELSSGNRQSRFRLTAERSEFQWFGLRAVFIYFLESLRQRQSLRFTALNSFWERSLYSHWGRSVVRRGASRNRANETFTVAAGWPTCCPDS